MIDAAIISLELINENKTKALAKNPLNGGIPAIEKKITKKEKAHRRFILTRFERLVKNSGVP